MRSLILLVIFLLGLSTFTVSSLKLTATLELNLPEGFETNGGLDSLINSKIPVVGSIKLTPEHDGQSNESNDHKSDTTEQVTEDPISALPSSVDWREKGAVSPVVNSLGCRSDWAHAATGAIEGAYFIKTGKLVPLSAQQILDCSREGHGCSDGGWTNHAYQYIIRSGGIQSEQTYPFEKKTGECRFNSTKVEVKLRSFVTIESGNENALMEAVATRGPVSVAISPPDDWYKPGVRKGECRGDPTFNGLVVGYGTDPVDGDYWILKVIYGEKWGEEGYVKMPRNQSNKCHIASAASYPIIE